MVRELKLSNTHSGAFEEIAGLIIVGEQPQDLNVRTHHSRAVLLGVVVVVFCVILLRVAAMLGVVMMILCVVVAMVLLLRVVVGGVMLVVVAMLL